jgi:hypothetical protein
VSRLQLVRVIIRSQFDIQSDDLFGFPVEILHRFHPHVHVDTFLAHKRKNELGRPVGFHNDHVHRAGESFSRCISNHVVVKVYVDLSAFVNGQRLVPSCTCFHNLVGEGNFFL